MHNGITTRKTVFSFHLQMEASTRSSVLLGFSKCETRLFIHIINHEYPISRVPEGEEKMKLHTVKKKKKKKRKLWREGWLLDGIAFIRAEAYLPRQTVLKKVTNEGSCLLLRHESLNEEIIPQGPLITSTRNNGSGREKEEDRDKGFIEG